MFRWFADFVRFWWALAYWNVRKTWFRLRGAHRDSCPCQAYSDSGLALDSRCEAVASWNDPRRFRRVCPLLVETRDGWRCSSDAERVRPFWGRASLYGAAAALVLYVGGATALFATLRVAKYDVQFVDLVWPPRWPELRRSQEQLFAARAQRALREGDYPTAILALQNVCQLNPRNYQAGIALANLLRIAGQSPGSHLVYERLMQAVPEQRPATARLWVQVLLCEGNYAAITPLAAEMLSEDSGHREAWMHALVFSVRQRRDPAALTPLETAEQGLPDWCTEIATTEALLLRGKDAQALPRLRRTHLRGNPRYLGFYQADRLLRAGNADDAVTVVNAYGNLIQPDEAAFLKIRAYTQRGWTSLAESEAEGLLALPTTPRLVALFSAHLLAYPSPTIARSFLQQLHRSPLPLNADSLAAYYAAYLAAVQNGQVDDAKQINAAITGFTGTDAKALRGLGDLLARPSSPQLSRVLPLVPLPIEVVYALRERADTGRHE